jgi:hypothetical protein
MNFLNVGENDQRTSRALSYCSILQGVEEGENEKQEA